FTEVSTGGYHHCGLKTDRSVACGGLNYYGQATPPAGAFTQVSAGREHTWGLKTDGTVAWWGSNTQGQATPPAGTFAQVSAGGAARGGGGATPAGCRGTAPSPAGAGIITAKRRHRRARSLR